MESSGRFPLLFNTICLSSAFGWFERHPKAFGGLWEAFERLAGPREFGSLARASGVTSVRESGRCRHRTVGEVCSVELVWHKPTSATRREEHSLNRSDRFFELADVELLGADLLR